MVFLDQVQPTAPSLRWDKTRSDQILCIEKRRYLSSGKYQYRLRTCGAQKYLLATGISETDILTDWNAIKEARASNPNQDWNSLVQSIPGPKLRSQSVMSSSSLSECSDRERLPNYNTVPRNMGSGLTPRNMKLLEDAQRNAQFPQVRRERARTNSIQHNEPAKMGQYLYLFLYSLRSCSSTLCSQLGIGISFIIGVIILWTIGLIIEVTLIAIPWMVSLALHQSHQPTPDQSIHMINRISAIISDILGTLSRMPLMFTFATILCIEFPLYLSVRYFPSLFLSVCVVFFGLFSHFIIPEKLFQPVVTISPSPSLQNTAMVPEMMSPVESPMTPSMSPFDLPDSPPSFSPRVQINSTPSGHIGHLTYEQTEALSNLRNRVRREITNFHSSFRITEDNTDRQLLRWLRMQKFNEEAAFNALKKCVQWRELFHGVGVNNITTDHVQGELDRRKFVFTGYTHSGVPAMWLSTHLHKKGDAPQREIEMTTVYILERVLWPKLKSHLPGPAGENMCLIADVGRWGLVNIDKDTTRFLAESFRDYYPECLESALVVDAPWMFSAVWKMLKNLLDPVTVSKVKFITRYELSQYIPASTFRKDDRYWQDFIREQGLEDG